MRRHTWDALYTLWWKTKLYALTLALDEINIRGELLYTQKHSRSFSWMHPSDKKWGTAAKSEWWQWSTALFSIKIPHGDEEKQGERGQVSFILHIKSSQDFSVACPQTQIEKKRWNWKCKLTLVTRMYEWISKHALCAFASQFLVQISHSDETLGWRENTRGCFPKRSTKHVPGIPS